MLSSARSTRHSPDQPASPSHIVHNHYHSPGHTLTQQDPGVHNHDANQSNTAPHHPYHSPQQQRAQCTEELTYNDNEQAALLSCSQFLQQARQPGQPRSPGRREKYSVRPRVSASDVVPPERVAEDALRATRVQYFADLQRLQEKRQQASPGVQ